VGHSLGGAVISRVAEMIPERIRTLVYLSAYLLPAGATVSEIARADAESLIAPNMIPILRGVTCALRDEVLADTFFESCSEEDRAWALERLDPQPLKPLVTPLEVSATRFGSVPRAYVETTRDRAVSLAAQRRMQAKLPCAPVFTLDGDHSPFLSQPEALARILISI
jgi:pimeloyl-ACP methyl ester carboxylesterase